MLSYQILPLTTLPADLGGLQNENMPLIAEQCDLRGIDLLLEELRLDVLKAVFAGLRCAVSTLRTPQFAEDDLALAPWGPVCAESTRVTSAPADTGGLHN